MTFRMRRSSVPCGRSDFEAPIPSASTYTRDTCRRSRCQAILDGPDRRQNLLTEGPAQNPLAIEPEALRENLDSAAQLAFEKRRGKDIGITQGRAQLIFHFAEDTLRIDGHPPTLAVVENVVVMQISMKHARVRLRLAQFFV